MEKQEECDMSSQEDREDCDWLRNNGFTLREAVDVLLYMDAGYSFGSAIAKLMKEKEEERKIWEDPITP